MDRIYCVPVDEMLKISGGMTRASNLASEFKAQGYLIPQSNNNNLWATIPDIGKIKHYRVSGEFFHSLGENDGTETGSSKLGIAAE